VEKKCWKRPWPKARSRDPAVAEDIAKVMAITKAKIGEDWVDKMNKRGLPGQKVLDRWVELLAKWHGHARI